MPVNYSPAKDTGAVPRATRSKARKENNAQKKNPVFSTPPLDEARGIGQQENLSVPEKVLTPGPLPVHHPEVQAELSRSIPMVNPNSNNPGRSGTFFSTMHDSVAAATLPFPQINSNLLNIPLLIDSTVQRTINRCN